MSICSLRAVRDTGSKGGSGSGSMDERLDWWDFTFVYSNGGLPLGSAGIRAHGSWNASLQLSVVRQASTPCLARSILMECQCSSFGPCPNPLSNWPSPAHAQKPRQCKRGLRHAIPTSPRSHHGLQDSGQKVIATMSFRSLATFATSQRTQVWHKSRPCEVNGTLHTYHEGSLLRRSS